MPPLKHPEIDSPAVLAPKVVGFRLREARLARGMTLAEVSQATGVCLPQISDIERGRSVTVGSFVTVAKIAAAVGASLDGLTDGIAGLSIVSPAVSQFPADCYAELQEIYN